MVCSPATRAFEREIRKISGPCFSTTREPKGWPRAKFTRLLEKIGGAFLWAGCPLKHVSAWLAGTNNLKITASLHTERSTLLYLDFDCHDGKGKIEDALTLLDLVRTKLPHGEPFVTERGVGAWVLVQHTELGPKNLLCRPVGASQYNATIDAIQAYVRGVAAQWGLELSSVEVHGRVIEFDTKPWVQVKRCPDLLKCPPGERHISSSVPYSFLRDQNWKPPVAPVKRKAALRGGSRAVHRITDEQVAGLDALATELVEAWFVDRPKRVGKWLISSRRFAEVLLTITTSKPNADRTMPFAMHRAAVQQLYAEGKFRHAWVHDVYVAVRGYLSAQGMLLAEAGGKYVPPIRDAMGAVLEKGKAARWRVVQWVRSHVNSFHEHGSIWQGLAHQEQPGDSTGSAEMLSKMVRKIGTKVVHVNNNPPPIGSHLHDLSLVSDWRPWCEWRLPYRQPPPDLAYRALFELGLAV